jgi:hypothetical protein
MAVFLIIGLAACTATPSASAAPATTVAACAVTVQPGGSDDPFDFTFSGTGFTEADLANGETSVSFQIVREGVPIDLSDAFVDVGTGNTSATTVETIARPPDGNVDAIRVAFEGATAPDGSDFTAVMYSALCRAEATFSVEE